MPTDGVSAKSNIDRAKSVLTETTPRLSASLLLLNGKNEVLMIQRTKDSRTFAGMHAFPGGNYDAAQDGPAKNPRMTALRETFEETGILLADPTSVSSDTPSPSALAVARRAIHSRTDPTTFPSFLADYNLSVQTAMNKLIPFSQWVTPTSAKSRFWTWFYVGFLDEMEGVMAAEDASVGGVSGSVEPTHDNHIEIQSAYFQPARSILESFNRGDISLMPPQYYLLTMLADQLDRQKSEATARGQGGSDALSPAGYLRAVVGGRFGERVFNPRFGGKVVGEDGVERSILMYEGDGMYDGKNSNGGGKHRSLLTFKEGRPSSIKIERDIDVLGVNSLANAGSAGTKL